MCVYVCVRVCAYARVSDIILLSNNRSDPRSKIWIILSNFTKLHEEVKDSTIAIHRLKHQISLIPCFIDFQ